MLALVPSISDLSDEYGELSRQIAAVKPAVDRQKVVGALILMRFEALPADQPDTAEGLRYTLQISPRENQTRVVSIRAVQKSLGAAQFLARCSITLKAIRESVTEAVFGTLVITERTGPRTIKAVAKMSPAEPAKIAA